MTNLYRATVGTLYTCDYSNESQSIESSHTYKLHEKYLGYLLVQQQKKKKKKKGKKNQRKEMGEKKESSSLEKNAS